VLDGVTFLRLLDLQYILARLLDQQNKIRTEQPQTRAGQAVAVHLGDIIISPCAHLQKP
jgi:hypothetical protein